MISLALYQPDQPGNCGTLFRLSACLGTKIHLIHPCGFSFSQKQWRRSAMDYADFVDLHEYDDYNDFSKKTVVNRKILLTTKTDMAFYDFKFEIDDILLLGQESAGVPADIHDEITHKVTIPMNSNFRSINMAISASMVLSEALRQTNGYNI